MLDSLTDIGALTSAVVRREISVEEIATGTLARLDAADREIRAFTAVNHAAVMSDARTIDRRIARQESVGQLVGVPLGVKDLFDVVNFPTSYGSEAVPSYLPNRDATAVARLRGAGALVIGKTRTAELAWSTDTPPTKNPTDSALICGGSSGGSAAAVGAGFVHAALGTDTGGSIRIPAALCGVVGIKPTYGLVGRGGILPANWSLDTAGPIARTVADVRLILQELVGHDDRDPSSALANLAGGVRERLRAGGTTSLRGLRLGIVEEALFEIVDNEARATHESLLESLANEGVELITLAFPEAALVPAALLAIDLPEGAAIHSELLKANGALITDAIRALLHVAHIIPGVIVARAHQARREVVARIRELFEANALDALIAPGNPAPAIRSDDLEHSYVRMSGERELALWAYARVCWLANLTGQPALVLPTVSTAPPLGVQLIGRPFRDDVLLGIAAAVEEILPIERSVLTEKEHA